jgi:hypothetical protein
MLIFATPFGKHIISGVENVVGGFDGAGQGAINGMGGNTSGGG